MREIDDSFGFKDILKKVFPQAIIKKCGNYDDYYWGYDIVPEYGIIMQFMSQMDDYTFLNIIARRVTMSSETPVKVIFRGDIPPDEDMNPDLIFIEQVLRNYKSFMR